MHRSNLFKNKLRQEKESENKSNKEECAKNKINDRSRDMPCVSGRTTRGKESAVPTQPKNPRRYPQKTKRGEE
jgi:hypothetical protein